MFNEVLRTTTGITVIAMWIVALLALLLCPLYTLFAINTLLEQGGINAYIPHNFHTYVAVYALMLVLKSSIIVKK